MESWKISVTTSAADVGGTGTWRKDHATTLDREEAASFLEAMVKVRHLFAHMDETQSRRAVGMALASAQGKLTVQSHHAFNAVSAALQLTIQSTVALAEHLGATALRPRWQQAWNNITSEGVGLAYFLTYTPVEKDTSLAIGAADTERARSRTSNCWTTPLYPRCPAPSNCLSGRADSPVEFAVDPQSHSFTASAVAAGDAGERPHRRQYQHGRCAHDDDRGEALACGELQPRQCRADRRRDHQRADPQPRRGMRSQPTDLGALDARGSDAVQAVQRRPTAPAALYCSRRRAVAPFAREVACCRSSRVAFGRCGRLSGNRPGNRCRRRIDTSLRRTT